MNEQELKDLNINIEDSDISTHITLHIELEQL